MAKDKVQKVQIVPPDPGPGVAVGGPALTERQTAGLDPLDPKHDAEQAADRDPLTNRQTDHEATNALDPVSGGPTPGVTADTPLTGKQQGQTVTDESGRPAMDANATPKDLQAKVRDGLTKARNEDRKAGVVAERTGWRDATQLGVSAAQIRKMIEAGAPLETEQVPGGANFPETGTRFRLK